jgi:hypothetical protein
MECLAKAGSNTHGKGRPGKLFYFFYLSPHSLTGEFNVMGDVF